MMAKLQISTLMAAMLLLYQNMGFCHTLNPEGLALLKLRDRVDSDPYGVLSDWNEREGETTPCSWFGVECYDARVLVLYLRDLCLQGTLPQELGHLTNLKSLNLHNNSFHGTIPKEIGELKELEVLDLGYNNFSGPFPFEFLTSMSLTTILIHHNELLESSSHELSQFFVFSEVHADDQQDYLSSCRCNFWNTNDAQGVSYRNLIQVGNSKNTPKIDNDENFLRVSTLTSSKSPSPDQRALSPSPSPLPSSPSPSPLLSPTGAASYLPLPFLLPHHHRPQSYSFLRPVEPIVCHSNYKNHIFIVLGVIGCSLFLMFSAVRLILLRRNKVVLPKSWNAGLNGKLRKAFVKGIPKLKRQELEAACEDFSNIIGFFFDEAVYKGTLSTGTEIAVISARSTNGEDWSASSEAQFWKKIQRLSKVNHKNFVNLIGYCEESEPFTRMMVFEYAPNGTLFEHLHIPDAETLNWGMRVRIAMGVAYCLEHLHSLTPPMVVQNLHSSFVYLTEDYAAKISYFSTWNEETLSKMTLPLAESPSPTAASNIYSFGVIMLEIITGRTPNLEGSGVLADWALVLLDGRHLPAGELVDLTTNFFGEDLRLLLDVIRDCVNPNPSLRPKMREITARLKQLTSITPEAASPKLSPLWWAELEILSTEAS